MAVRRFSFLAMAALLLAVHAVSAQEFFLKKGDVVVVMGDSITEQRLYSNYLEIWSQTRFPSHDLVFRNVGIGGDTSGGGNGRFKRDVLPFKPTVLTVDFGMNDGGYIWPGKIANKKEITEKDVDARLATYAEGLAGDRRSGQSREHPRRLDHAAAGRKIIRATPTINTIRPWRNSPRGSSRSPRRAAAASPTSFIPIGRSFRKRGTPAKKAASLRVTRSIPAPRDRR